MESKNTTIIVVCVIGLLIAILFAFSKGCDKTDENKVVVVPQQNFTGIIGKKEDEFKTTSRGFSSSYSGGSGNYDSGESAGQPALYTEEELQRRSKRIKERKEKIAELKKEHLEKILNDPNLSIEAQEQLKIRNHPSFFKGMKAFKNQNYKEAMVGFSEVLKDKEATPLAKYYASWNLMQIARETNNFELFFLAARTRASLIAKEDLSIIDIEKSNTEMEKLDLVENTLKAIKDPKYFDICVKNKLKGIDTITKEEEERAQRKVKEDIEYYSRVYKELIK